MLLSLARTASEFRTRLVQTAVEPFTDRIVCRVTKISPARVASRAKGQTIRKVMVGGVGGGGWGGGECGELSGWMNFFFRSLLVQEFFFEVNPSARIFFSDKYCFF